MEGTLPETDAVQYECLVECGEGVGQGGDDCCQADVVTNAIFQKNIIGTTVIKPLFVFSIVGPKQNAGSLLTLVSDTVFYALSHGTLGFALHGSSFNHFFQRI